MKFHFIFLKEQAANALKLDRTPIEGRPVYVSPNEDKSLDFGQNKFKYGTGLEKNKLFVSGLPFAITKEELEKIFGEVCALQLIMM